MLTEAMRQAGGVMSHKVEVVDGNVCIHIGTTPVADIYRHIEVMSPDEARAFASDVTTAIESIAPVRIDRWLTQADIEKHGDRWEWHSDEWAVANDWTFTATFASGRVVLIRGNADYFSGMFSKDDYFTPIKGDK